ncbi:hypothetical protein J6590_014969 [Homalodisca vitripennis]|nr:hypothetical protein J6590_014969 [Homalodisca vitripennis]
MPRRSRIPSNYQTRIRVRGQRHVFLGGWKLSTQENVCAAVPWLGDSSSDNSSSDDDLVLLYSVAQRDYWVHPINKKRRMFGEYHHLMHDLEADDDKFRLILKKTMCSGRLFPKRCSLGIVLLKAYTVERLPLSNRSWERDGREQWRLILFNSSDEPISVVKIPLRNTRSATHRRVANSQRWRRRRKSSIV